MDPLSITASLVAIIQLAATITQSLKEIKSGSEDRIRLREEIRTTSCLLEILHDRVDDADAPGQDLSSIKLLNVPGGPLDHMKNILSKLKKKLAPENRLLKMSQGFSWPLSRRDVNDFLDIIERQKNTFSLAIQNDNIGLSLAIKNDISEIADKVNAIELRHEWSQKRILDEDDQKIVTWLSPTTYAARHQDIMSRRTEGTGKWFLEAQAFKQWLNGTEKLLLCPGIPGAGKTVIASIVVDHLQATILDSKSAVAFIYCNYKERSQQTLTNLLSSVARQLIDRSNLIPDQLRSSYSQRTKDETRPSHQDLLELLADIGSGFSSIFLVIDALDECNPIDGTRTSLVSSLRKHLHQRTHLLITSRPSGDIESLFKDCPQLEIKSSEGDIRRYVSSRLMREPRLVNHVTTDAVFLNMILDTIVAKSDGMFLLAQLHIGALSRQQNKRAIRSALHTLPAEIDVTYQDAVRRIRDQCDEDVRVATNILTLVCHAVRPLKIDELRHALATLDHEGVMEIDDEELTDSEILISICAGIVTIDKESSLVRLVHYTAQEYFDRNPIVAPSNAQEMITKTCLSYLLLSDIAQGPCSNAAMRERFESKPFLRYAAENWNVHARGKPELACRETILLLINDEKARDSAYRAGIRPRKKSERSIVSLLNSGTISKLSFAALVGLTDIVKYLITQDEDIEAGDWNGFTPLMQAAEGGHPDTVEALLAGGADINKCNDLGFTVLMCAIMSGHEETVTAVINHGARLEASQDEIWFESPLEIAVRHSHINIVSLLLKNGATVGYNPFIRKAVEDVLSQSSKISEI